MPWHAAKSSNCPTGKPWAVIKDTDMSVVACHATKAGAQKQVAALYANESTYASADKQDVDSVDRAVWTTAYINDLPDSAFLYIESGGEKDSDGKTTPRSLRHFPYKDTNGAIDLPHLRNALARIPQSSLSSDVKSRLTAKAQRLLANQRSEELPSEDFYRADFGSDLAVREEVEDENPVLFGHFARFGEWTEINSVFEGNFMERFLSGAFKKTIAENRNRMRVLFQHGKDILGQQVLGPIQELREDERGAYYEVPLFEGIPPLVLSGLRAGQYGSSFRFRVLKWDHDKNPEKSEYNPKGLPERSIKEAFVPEFGPVTFPQYAGATADVRSLTDDFRLPGLHDLIAAANLNLERAAALPESEDEEHSESDSRRSRSTPKRDYLSDKEAPTWRL
jgi:hypothetical protein